MIRDWLTSRLTDLGFGSIRQVSTGYEALVTFHEFNPELVILDTTLPDHDGVKVLSRIKGSSSTTTVLMLGHVFEKQTIDSCEKLGAEACLRKPDDLYALLTFIQQRVRSGNPAECQLAA